MKKPSQQPDDMLYLATDRVMFHVKEPYRIQEEMIEMKNFIPEAFMIHQFQEYKDLEMECYDCIRVTKREALASMIDLNSDRQPQPLLMSEEDGGDDDWDDDDEDWDEEDEEWDDDDEDDDDWDDDDDEDWDEDDDDFDEDDAEDDAE